MKFFILFVSFLEASSLANEQGIHYSPPLFEYIQVQYERKNFENTKHAFYHQLDTTMPSKPYDCIKVDIKLLEKWKNTLSSSDDPKTILEILVTLDLPFTEFLSKPVSLELHDLAKYLENYIDRIKNEYNKIRENYKTRVSRENAINYYKTISKGSNEEEKKATISDPINLPILSFFPTTNVSEKSRVLGQFLLEVYDLKLGNRLATNSPTKTPSISSPSPIAPTTKISKSPSPINPSTESFPDLSINLNQINNSNPKDIPPAKKSSDNPTDILSIKKSNDNPTDSPSKKKPRKSKSLVPSYNFNVLTLLIPIFFGGFFYAIGRFLYSFITESNNKQKEE